MSRKYHKNRDSDEWAAWGVLICVVLAVLALIVCGPKSNMFAWVLAAWIVSVIVGGGSGYLLSWLANRILHSSNG